MRVPVFVHHVETAYSNAALGSDDRALPISEIWGKTNDGLGWQATWDRHPAAIGDLAGVRRAAHEVYAPQGIRYRPWGVVHGRWPGQVGYAAGEGRLAGTIARAAARPGERACYLVDLEPHYHGGAAPQFWRDDLGAGPAEVAAWFDAFAAAGGDEVWVVPDARDPHMQPVAFRTWAEHPLVTQVAPQVYVTDFVRPRQPTAADVRAALERALATLAAHGWPQAARVCPVLPGDASPERLAEGVAYARELGCAGVAIWQRATLRPDSAVALAALPDPWRDPVPAVPGSSAALRRHLDRARRELDAAAMLLDGGQ